MYQPKDLSQIISILLWLAYSSCEWSKIVALLGRGHVPTIKNVKWPQNSQYNIFKPHTEKKY
jgi:hypothetical protein